jgi:glycosyltransferase involved in cell wall biosynthesis
MISVIIPTYNRKTNLRRVFAALAKQDFNKDLYEVVVSDDGSQDNSVEAITEFQDRLNFQYYWQPNKGFRAPIVRNMGAKLAKGDKYLFLDSDVMLWPGALSMYQNITTANPDAIIAGRYDWLEPMDFSVHDVYANWDKIITNQMPHTQTGPMKGIIGPDLRSIGVSMFDEQVKDNYCLGLFSGNMLIPKDMFWSVGGFDEAMVGHGGEDCEFAMRLQEAGNKAIFTQYATGYHIYHDRNQEKNMEEVNINIEYMKKKHHNFMVKLGIIDGNVEAGELPLIQK